MFRFLPPLHARHSRRRGAEAKGQEGDDAGVRRHVQECGEAYGCEYFRRPFPSLQGGRLR